MKDFKNWVYYASIIEKLKVVFIKNGKYRYVKLLSIRKVGDTIQKKIKISS